MKRSLTYLFLLPALLLTACQKPVTVQPERHIKCFDTIPLGQPVDSFFKLYSVIMLEEGIAEWTMEKYADKAYFHFRDDDGNSEEYYNQSFMGDLYNDTIYCFYEGEEWESPEIPYAQGYMDHLKAICDTVFIDEPGYLHTREFRPGGYVDVIISQSGRIFAYTDSIAYARYEQLHK